MDLYLITKYDYSQLKLSHEQSGGTNIVGFICTSCSMVNNKSNKCRNCSNDKLEKYTLSSLPNSIKKIINLNQCLKCKDLISYIHKTKFDWTNSNTTCKHPELTKIEQPEIEQPEIEQPEIEQPEKEETNNPSPDQILEKKYIIKPCRINFFTETYKISVSEPLFNLYFDINHFFNTVKTRLNGHMLYGSYDFSVIIDKIKYKKKQKVDRVIKRINPGIQILPEKEQEEKEQEEKEQEEQEQEQEKYYLCNIYKETNIEPLQVKRGVKNKYPYYFYTEISDFYPENYSKTKKFSKTKNIEKLFFKDELIIIVPNTEKFNITTEDLDCEKNIYYFTCYLKDEAFIKKINELLQIQDKCTEEIEIEEPYKYSSIFTLNKELLENIKLKIELFFLIQHNINKEYIQIYIRTNKTYINFIYFNIYIVNTKKNILYMEFLNRYSSIYINDCIKIFEKWIGEYEKNINYIIKIDGYEKQLIESTLTRARYWLIPKEDKKTNITLDIIKTLDIRFFSGKKIDIKYYNFLKNDFHTYCDKHILFSCDGKEYELSLKAIGFENDNATAMLQKLTTEREYKITDSISRYYLKLPIKLEIKCTNYTEPVIDNTGVLPAAEEPPSRIIIDADLILTITLFINKYYYMYKDKPDEYNKIQPILDLINEKILLLKLELHNLSSVKSTKNFLVIERDVGSALNDTLVNVYKTKDYRDMPSAFYDILYYVPENFMGEILKNKDFFTNFTEMMILVAKKHEDITGDIKEDTKDKVIFDKIKLFKSTVNNDSEIYSIYSKIFPLQVIYNFSEDHPFNSFSEELRKEIDGLIKDKYSGLFVTIKPGKRFKIFHMHLIKNYNKFRIYIKRHLIDSDHKKISYPIVRDGKIV